MKLTKSKLKEIIREVITETEAEGYDDPAYRATIEQFKGKRVSKEEFAQALAMHHDSMKNEVVKRKIREELLNENSEERRILSIVKDIERYKIKYLKDAVRKSDWHEIQELGYTLESMGKTLVKLGIKAGK